MKQQEAALHKKRYGQYFSGKKVADMLFSLLPKDQVWSTVVDPMAGIGDMLVAVRANTEGRPKLLGVEIDDAVAKECASRLPDAVVLCDDAFKCNGLLTTEGFDLVITNPPYVRYQLQSDDEVMPSAQVIRANLIHQIEKLAYLSEAEKQLFLKLAKNYSGLSDMAVPAWLLCAALVRKDGYLAVVVPETWLNREYAAPIQYLLQKCFTIETIARDTDASWFSEALAERLGTSDVYIGYLEQGKRHGTLETFINIVNILGYSMDDLLEMYLVRSAPDAFDTKLLVENCTQKERDLIFHMIHEVLLFTRSRQ